jgi:hypothetical protein
MDVSRQTEAGDTVLTASLIGSAICLCKLIVIGISFRTASSLGHRPKYIQVDN